MTPFEPLCQVTSGRQTLSDLQLPCRTFVNGGDRDADTGVFQFFDSLGSVGADAFPEEVPKEEVKGLMSDACGAHLTSLFTPIWGR